MNLTVQSRYRMQDLANITLALFVVGMLTACESTAHTTERGPTAPADTTIQPTRAMPDYTPSFEKAHPVAKALMSNPFYWSPIEETAPFGSDDGADAYAGFVDWRATNPSGDPRQYLMQQISRWGYPLFDLNETVFDKLRPYLEQSNLATRYMSGIDAAIAAISFGQLYLEGTIDKDLGELAITSMKRQLHPDMLALWGESYKNVRKSQLSSMLAILQKLNGEAPKGK